MKTLEQLASINSNTALCCAVVNSQVWLSSDKGWPALAAGAAWLAFAGLILWSERAHGIGKGRP